MTWPFLPQPARRRPRRTSGRLLSDTAVELLAYAGGAVFIVALIVLGRLGR